MPRFIRQYQINGSVILLCIVSNCVEHVLSFDRYHINITEDSQSLLEVSMYAVKLILPFDCDNHVIHTSFPDPSNC